jgi:hypothetical protein
MSKLPFDSEEDDVLGQLDYEEYYPEETFGDRLRLFYDQFDGATRVLLGEALFRETPAGLRSAQALRTASNGHRAVQHLEILCPNAIIYRRLVQKRQKIANEIRWIWPETMTEVWIGIHRQPEIATVFALSSM